MMTKAAAGIVLLAFAAIVPFATVACGGDASKDPKTAANTPPSTSETSSSSTPADTGSAPASASAKDPTPPASTPDTAAAPPADAGPPPPKPVSFETKDECTPVGIDFEKRARPALKACYAEGKKKNANLEGTVKIKLTVDVKGKIKSTKVVEKTLPDPVANCMLDAVKKTPFPEVEKCWDASITIPITFPTPH